MKRKPGTRTYFIGGGLLLFGALLGGIAWRPVPAVRAQNTNVDWPYYGNDPANTRYQNVDVINLSNASTLRPAWIFHTGVHDKNASMEVSPLVVNGTMYLTTGHDDVFALNAATGRQIWHYKPNDMPSFSQLALCCSENNRGVAAGSGRIFLGRLDATLVALDQATGSQLWRAVVDDYTKGYSITMAPQYIQGKVIVGVSGGEYLVRGHVDAYDANTGALLWRFYTTEPGTWANNSYLTGGGPVWQTPAFDLAQGYLYVAVGNAGSDINGKLRAGTNLYTVSVVALDINTGTVRWYFQESHHDLWDYDAAPPPLLFGASGIAHAGKTGYLFLLDRTSGAPLFPVNEVPVPVTPGWQHPWPTQPESTVESLTPHTVSSVPSGYTAAPQWTPPQSTTYVIQPGDAGGLEWPPMAYSPRTQYIYQPARYQPVSFYTTSSNTTGGTYPGWGSTSDDVPGIGTYGLYGAVSTTTGKIVWSFRSNQPAGSGMLVAGDLVFFGETSGLFHAVNATTGAVLWTFNGASVPGGGAATAAPVAYEVNGREFIANAFGGNPNENGPLGDAMIAFSLPGKK